MTTLAEVRAKHPEYNDLSDEALAQGLYKKYYSDMPYDQFAVKVGLKPQAPEVTAADRAKAAIGGTNRGVAGLLGLPVDTAENIINLGIAAYGRLIGTTPDLIQNSVGGSQSIANAMERVLGRNAASNPRPEDVPSQMLYRAGTVAGGSMVPGASVPGTLASATGAAVAEQLGGPQWAGVGALAPAAATQAASALKSAIANPQTVQRNVQNFQQSGSVPSVGQATENPFFRGLENLVSKFPGGVGVMERFVKKQQAELGSPLQTGTSAEAAGRAIEKGVTGEGGFIDRTRATWQNLDNAVAAKIPKGASFAPTNTLQALDDLTSTVKGAEKTTGALVNPKLAEIKNNLAADLQANNGAVPFDALRALRAKVGSMLDDSLVTGIPGGELKRLYGALSKDLESAANQAGAGQEFSRQQNFYRARMDRIDTVLDRVIGKNRQPEDIYNLVIPSNKDQSSKLTATLRSIKPEERQVVTETVVNGLGRASPGRQNAAGDVWSSETFLTNWGKLGDKARMQLFPDTKMRANLEALAKVSEDIRTGAKVFQNPSGTAGSFAAYSVYSSPITAIGAWLAGGTAAGVGVLAAAGGSTTGSFLTAKLMTNPKFVDWLAQTPKLNTQQMPAHLARLGVLYNEIDDPQTKQDLATFVNQAAQAK